jgi:hypothetical protein
VELCLFSSALPGWDPARVADSARAVGLTTVEWGVGPGQALESPLRAAHALRDLGRPTLALLRREVDLLRALLPR